MDDLLGSTGRPWVVEGVCVLCVNAIATAMHSHWSLSNGSHSLILDSPFLGLLGLFSREVGEIFIEFMDYVDSSSGSK